MSDFSLWRPGPSPNIFIGQGCHDWNYWIVYKSDASQWYWQDIVTDEWDVINEQEIEIIEDEGGPFDTWQEAAADCELASGRKVL